MTKKHAKHLWTAEPKYKQWVKIRDRALEKLHTRAQVESADVMRKVLADTLLVASGNFPAMKAGHPHGVESFEHMLKVIFSNGCGALYQIMLKLRQRSYVLSKASEAEIIARMSLGQRVVANIRADHLFKAMNKPTVAGGAAAQRLTHYMDRLRRKITSFAQGAALNAPDVEAFLQDVMACFPPKRVVKRPKRVLKPALMEAAQDLSTDPQADVAIDNIDAEAWQDMLSAYMNDYVPQNRGPEAIGLGRLTGTFTPTPAGSPSEDSDVWYAWEFEQDMTEEFVQSVRDGQLEAANENGITDFVVISIIDDSTCNDCCGGFGCVDFDGLLVSEVEEMTDGEQTVAPYHFKCRCTFAPATDNIPDKPDDNMDDVFADWLMS